MADQVRYEELLKKRGEVGLSDKEADELGRILAEMEGKPYANAQSLKRSGGELEEVPPESEVAAATSSGEAATSPEGSGASSDQEG
jgi:hypothetical protein